MNVSQLLVIIGLCINTLASLTMLFPYLKITRNVEDNFILSMDRGGKYTQKKHKKNRLLGIVGFSLFIMGFIFQIIGITITLRK